MDKDDQGPLHIPTLSIFMGVPVSEMPRDELEREFVKAHQTIQRLQLEICNRSIEHIRDLAALSAATPQGHC